MAVCHRPPERGTPWPPLAAFWHKFCQKVKSWKSVSTVVRQRKTGWINQKQSLIVLLRLPLHHSIFYQSGSVVFDVHVEVVDSYTDLWEIKLPLFQKCVWHVWRGYNGVITQHVLRDKISRNCWLFPNWSSSEGQVTPFDLIFCFMLVTACS